MKRIADAEPRDLDAWTISMTLGELSLCFQAGTQGRLDGAALPGGSCGLLSLIHLIMLGRLVLLLTLGCSRRGVATPGSQCRPLRGPAFALALKGVDRQQV